MILRWLCVVGTLSFITADFHVPLQYSLSDDEEYAPLGTIVVERSFDGNYTARFMPSADTVQLRKQLLEAAAKDHLYRVRIKEDDGRIQGYNHPVCDGWIPVV
ncbi:unnamed protein product [Toxocara canis]|uniref:Secreted protein n=1 Tax=Toxocara canis TaxID=6265 RepID=A0A183U760_TOXCA|nr:unnamed protein product [Toxocara canis]